MLGTAAALFGGGGLVYLLRGDEETTVPAQIAALAVTVLVLAGIAMCASTALKGRPRWVVPPHLRVDREDA